MSHAQMTSQTNKLRAGRHSWRIALIIVAIFALAGAGWWSYQAGLLDQFRGLAAQTPATATAASGQREDGQAQEPVEAFGQRAEGSAAASNRVDGAVPARVAPATTATSELPSDAVVVEAAESEDSAGNDAADAAVDPAEAAPAAPISLPVIAGVDGIQLWGDGGNLLASLDPGASLTANGRSADGVWLAVEAETGDGWVQAVQGIGFGMQKLPVVKVPVPVLAAASQSPAADPAETGSLLIAGDTPAAEAAGSPSAGLETAGSAETQQLTATVYTTGDRLNVRSGPGTGYAIIAKAESGDEYAVVGRTESGDWLQLVLPGVADSFGWVSADFVQLDGQINAVPVSDEASALPVAGEAPEALVQTVAATTDAAASAPAVTAAATATGLQGTLVFQQSPGGMIYAYDLETGVLWQLTNGFDPAISPDGSTVAFVRDGGEAGLYFVDIDGSNERLVFGERGKLSSPKWSPDGRWIVFSRNDEYNECYDMGFNQCISPAEFADRFPDGNGPDVPLVKWYQSKLSAVDINGDNFHDMATLDSAKAPDWNEAGIVYQSDAGLQRTGDSADAVNQLVAFDNLKPFYHDPDWQAGGGQIAFQVKGAAQWEIYVVNPDGSGMTALTRPVTTLVDELPSNVAPVYSPDGSLIVFLSNRGEDNSAGAWQLWVMDADGSNQQPLPIDVPIEYTFGLEQIVSWGA